MVGLGGSRYTFTVFDPPEMCPLSPLQFFVVEVSCWLMSLLGGSSDQWNGYNQWVINYLGPMNGIYWGEITHWSFPFILTNPTWHASWKKAPQSFQPIHLASSFAQRRLLDPPLLLAPEISWWWRVFRGRKRQCTGESLPKPKTPNQTCIMKKRKKHWPGFSFDTFNSCIRWGIFQLQNHREFWWFLLHPEKGNASTHSWWIFRTSSCYFRRGHSSPTSSFSQEKVANLCGWSESRQFWSKSCGL